MKNWKFRGMWICKKIDDLGIKVLRGESLEGYGFAKNWWFRSKEFEKLKV